MSDPLLEEDAGLRLGKSFTFRSLEVLMFPDTAVPPLQKRGNRATRENRYESVNFERFAQVNTSGHLLYF